MNAEQHQVSSCEEESDMSDIDEKENNVLGNRRFESKSERSRKRSFKEDAGKYLQSKGIQVDNPKPPEKISKIENLDNLNLEELSLSHNQLTKITGLA